MEGEIDHHQDAQQQHDKQESDQKKNRIAKIPLVDMGRGNGQFEITIIVVLKDICEYAGGFEFFFLFDVDFTVFIADVLNGSGIFLCDFLEKKLVVGTI